LVAHGFAVLVPLFFFLLYTLFIHLMLLVYTRALWDKLGEDSPRLSRLVEFVLKNRRRVNLASLMLWFGALAWFSYAFLGYFTSLFVGFGLGWSAGFFCSLVLLLVLLVGTREAVQWLIVPGRPLIIYSLIGSFRALYYLVSPLVTAFTKIASLALKIGKETEVEPFLTQEELSLVAEIHDDDKREVAEERVLIQGVVEFADTIVREVMVPRIDMVCARTDMKLEEVIELIHRAGHSRIPLYECRMDNIVGILYAKDLLTLGRDAGDKPLVSLARQAHFIPESKKISELLREFQRERFHMAIVVDEYGGTAGLVTLEDIIEEIVGEIQDEYDSEKPLYEVVDERTVLVNPKMNIDELNELFGLELPSNGYETLAGFILERMGRVPRRGEEVEYQGVIVRVENSTRQNIILIRLILPHPIKNGAR